MSDIPADIAETARRFIDTLQRRIKEWGEESGAFTNLTRIEFERALLVERRRVAEAERERAAAIATKPHPHDTGRPFWSQGKSIAQAIRNGDKCLNDKAK